MKHALAAQPGAVGQGGWPAVSGQKNLREQAPKPYGIKRALSCRSPGAAGNFSSLALLLLQTDLVPVRVTEMDLPLAIIPIDRRLGLYAFAFQVRVRLIHIRAIKEQSS